jgi:aspartate ammonia-lyase
MTPPPNWPPAGSQTGRARALYRISPYATPLSLVRSLLLVKLAACRCNARLGHLSATAAARLEAAIEEFRHAPDGDLADWFRLDAFQGGAGTSLNMMVNEALAFKTGLDVYAEVNLHQSTNDVLPTALKLSLLDELAALEPLVARLQTAAQDREQAFAGSLVAGHTQLQDAVAMDAGRIFAAWAGALQRDRWRVFKARERLKEVNLGGTAVGTGAGAPRQYVLTVIRELQALTPHPVSRAEDPVEATANWDAVAEAMSVLNVLAQNLKRVATDIRLLASGPASGLGLLVPPALLKGSSIMPGKVNPVMAEAAWQVAERVMANDGLIGRLCAAGELQLNACFPLISFTCLESLTLLAGILPGFADYVAALELDRGRAAGQVAAGSAGSLALTPLLGYQAVETLVGRSRASGASLRTELEREGLFAADELDAILSPRALGGMGYDEARYAELHRRHGPAIAALRARLEAGAHGAAGSPGTPEPQA